MEPRPAGGGRIALGSSLNGAMRFSNSYIEQSNMIVGLAEIMIVGLAEV
jgi:hypothetical protein